MALTNPFAAQALRQVQNNMVVLVLVLSERQRHRVRVALSHVHQLLFTSSVAEAHAVLGGNVVDVLVVDSVVGNALPRIAATAEEFFALGHEFPYLPTVFCASQPATALTLIARFPTRETSDAIVMGLDDALDEVVRVVESVAGVSLVARLLHRVGAEGALLPNSLIRAVRSLFSSPRLFRTVDDIAAVACMSRRTLDRWLSRLGIVSGAELLHVAHDFVGLRRSAESLGGRARAADAPNSRLADERRPPR